MGFQSLVASKSVNARWHASRPPPQQHVLRRSPFDRRAFKTAQRACVSWCSTSEASITEDTVFADSGDELVETEAFLGALPAEPVAGAYAIYSSDKDLQFVGISQDLKQQFAAHKQAAPEQLRAFVRVRILRDVALATEERMIAQARVWIDEGGGHLPPGNDKEAHLWGPPAAPAATPAGAAAEGGVRVSPFSKATVHRQVGESDVAQGLEMTVESVDKALNDIRQYLFADGGDITVLRVEAGNVYVQFEGACASCSSQETTMAMGVQRALSAAFGEQLKEVIPVEEEAPAGMTPEGLQMTVPAVDSLLALLRPAVANYGGSMEVLSVDGGVCRLQYSGPDAIWTGVKMAIYDKFGDEVQDVVKVEGVDAGGRSVEAPVVE